MRPEIMSQLDGSSNVALLTTRRTTGRPFDNFLVTRDLVEYKAATHDRNTQVFPLYLTGASASRGLFAAEERLLVPNLSPEFVAEMEAKLGLKFVPEQPEAVSDRRSADSAFGPEDVFDYIYAIFHSPTYRKRYAEFLKIDFPRVPLTSDKKLFWKLVALGRELVALHLLESPKVNDFVTKYPKKGSDTVEKVACDDNKARVLINDEQYFEGVKPEWFEFHIGGYQVLQKWLKDRKGRKLSNDDITHYQRVVVAIRETIRLMAEIDETIPKWPVE
jgi:predicted helicase